MFRETFVRVPAPASRMASGIWDGDRESGEGDIYASYSADIIATEGKVRTSFRHGSHLWTCVAIFSGPVMERQCEAYRLLPLPLFQGTFTTYAEKVKRNGGEDARNDSDGFYHGMRVTRGSEIHVLTGPPLIFVATPEPEAPEQLTLF